MKSTPARLLQRDDLIVEPHGTVYKVTDVELFPTPQKVVTVDLRDQITGVDFRRNLRGGERVTIEEPFTVSVGTGEVTVELARVADGEGRAVYRFHIEDHAGGIDHQGADLHLGARLRPDNVSAAKTLLSNLQRAAEAWETELEGGIDSEALDRWPEHVCDWAYENAEAIEMAQVELIRGLER
jgi:hypothetical protein